MVATAEPLESLGNVTFEADLILPEPGDWTARIAVDGPEGFGEAEFRTEVLAARTIPWHLIVLAGAVGVVFLAAAGLRRRRKSGAGAAQPRRQIQRQLKESNGNV